MPRASHSLLWATVLASVVLTPAASALAAAGTSTSAGDQQYLDPLASGTTSATPPSPPPPSAGAAASASPAPAARPPTDTARHDQGSHTLPYTGFNVWLLVWVGLGLIALGLLLRCLARRRARPDAS